MSKMALGIGAGVISFLTFASLGAITSSGGKFDYATADEERQQKHLESIAKGFRAGFKLTAGNNAEISNTFVDSSLDMISFTIQLKNSNINNVPHDYIEKQRLLMQKKSCKQAHRQKLLDNGITMRMRFYRPGGGKLMTVEVNEESCAEYVV